MLLQRGARPTELAILPISLVAEKEGEVEGPKLEGAIEKRIDPADGALYSLEDFIAEYGGSVDEPPALWVSQKHTRWTTHAGGWKTHETSKDEQTTIEPGLSLQGRAGHDGGGHGRGID